MEIITQTQDRLLLISSVLLGLDWAFWGTVETLVARIQPGRLGLRFLLILNRLFPKALVLMFLLVIIMVPALLLLDKGRYAGVDRTRA